MFEMKLATCAALMGVLPESTGSLKTSYFSRESISRAARPKEARGLYLPLKKHLSAKNYYAAMVHATVLFIARWPLRRGNLAGIIVSSRKQYFLHVDLRKCLI